MFGLQLSTLVRRNGRVEPLKLDFGRDGGGFVLLEFRNGEVFCLDSCETTNHKEKMRLTRECIKLQTRATKDVTYAFQWIPPQTYENIHPNCPPPL
ncbi:MAG: hypothetical protein WEC84_02145 [Candidatus Andersenbacteria bacterium]